MERNSGEKKAGRLNVTRIKISELKKNA